jgi:oxygen-independent coproporphyrinogen-3 oxidase
VELIEAGSSAVTQSWQLSEDDRRAESMFLGLRLMKGISLRYYQEIFEIDVCEKYRDDLNRFLAAGLIEIRGDLLKLTRTGALLSNEVFTAFV